YCNACHTSYGLNAGGGMVFASGLPLGGYTAGTTYPFSVTIAHGTADRTRWGFSIAARNQLGAAVGTFTPSGSATLLNPNGGEMGHLAAVFTAPANQYTYAGLAWTAPAAPTTDDVTINFYIAGNASNGNGFNDEDYIYTSTSTITLPVRFGYFRTKVEDGYKAVLEWQTTQESNTAFFVVERSTDGLTFTAIDSVPAAGNASTPRNYRFTDALPRVFDRAVFYRLKQTDRNGQYMYSAIEKVQLKNPGTFIRNIMPNPVKWGQPFYAEIVSAQKMNTRLTLVNLQGRIVYSQQAQLFEGINTINMNPGFWLPAGHYFLTISNEQVKQRVSVLVH
ncbi:MAG: T9SS type A sorting domain-containing protein, partial [Dinghuibacter sp.]|nr:T9SS type A sorting domain-containing protein [Dinghuibacter sp.]